MEREEGHEGLRGKREMMGERDRESKDVVRVRTSLRVRKEDSRSNFG
jgi:hypothetical protein